MRSLSHIIAVTCLACASWSTVGVAAERASVLDAYYMDPPPKSAYFGKMKAKWANHVKSRHPQNEVDLMPAKTVRVPKMTPKKTVTVPRMTPKAEVRRFMAPRTTVEPVAQTTTSQALPWQDLPAR